MIKTGFSKDINKEMYDKGWKGYVQWNDGSISFYKTRQIAKEEVRRDKENDRH